MNQEEFENLVDQACDIYDEIFTLEQSHDKMKEMNISRLYYYAQFYYERLNELIKELKDLISKHEQLALSENQKEYIRDVKSKIWCSCSAEFQYEVGKHWQDYASID